MIRILLIGDLPRNYPGIFLGKFTQGLPKNCILLIGDLSKIFLVKLTQGLSRNGILLTRDLSNNYLGIFFGKICLGINPGITYPT